MAGFCSFAAIRKVKLIVSYWPTASVQNLTESTRQNFLGFRLTPPFRSAFKQRRCLIPASGFYEWQKLEACKQAFHIHRQDLTLFAFAGLWEQWQHDAETLYSCTIITTAATELMQPIHDRMPVIIPPEHYHDWLDKSTGADEAFGLLNNQYYLDMTASPVSDWVNSPTHDDERCIV